MAVMVPWKGLNQWRETGRIVKFGPLDGRLGIFIILMFLIPSLELLVLCIISLMIFNVLQYYGYTLPNAQRKIFTMISGKRKSSIHFWRERKFRY